MNPDRKVKCVLCKKSYETKVTGALETKDDVTAHRNCLFFSSGIFCQNAPEFDDLLGFSVVDVMNEVKRGSKLTCNKCKMNGATVGCELKRCKKSFHFPCAIQAGATTAVEDGHYKLFCSAHKQERNKSVNETNASSSKKSSKAASVKDPTSENTEGSVPLEKLNNNIISRGSCSVNHAPSTSRNMNGGSSVHSSASNPTSSTTCPSHKRRLSFGNQEEDNPPKRSRRARKRIPDNLMSSDSDETDKDATDMSPLDSDLQDSLPEEQSLGESSTGTAAGNEWSDESRNEDQDEAIIVSKSESQSLLMLPVKICISDSQPADVLSEDPSKQQVGDKSPESVDIPVTDGPPISSKAPSPSSHRSNPCAVTDSRPQSSSSASSPPPAARATQPLDSTSFWKWCNAAQCTEGIFTGFINEMSAISRRIQSDQASKEDCDVALEVMKASGKLEKFIIKQQEELETKLEELQRAAAALDEVASALVELHQ